MGDYFPNTFPLFSQIGDFTDHVNRVKPGISGGKQAKPQQEDQAQRPHSKFNLKSIIDSQNIQESDKTTSLKLQNQKYEECGLQFKLMVKL